MATTTTKTRANASTENQVVVDVSPVLWHVGEPTDSPLITLFGGMLYKDGKSEPQEVKGVIGSEKCVDTEYKIIEKDPLARYFTTSSAVADTTTETVSVASSAFLTGGETVRNEATGEVGYVYEVTSSTAIKIRRNLGSTEYQIGAADTWKVIGHAVAEGSAKRSMKAQLAAPRTRKLQIMKRSWGVTGTAAKVELETNVELWDEEQTQSLVNHKKDAEFSFWFNPAVDSTTDTSSNTVNLCRGILAEIDAESDGDIDCNGALTEEMFFGEVAQRIFEYGPSKKTFFADARMRSVINGWSRVKTQTAVKETVYGLVVRQIETGHGILEMMNCGVFDEFLRDDESGFGVALDLERVKKKYLEGRDTLMQTDIQTPGTDAREAQYISEIGLALYSRKHHRKVRNIG